MASASVIILVLQLTDAMRQAKTPAAPEQALPDPIAAVRRHDKDVGSTPAQIGLLTGRIRHLTGHAGVHPKDFHTRRGLIGLVNQRRKLLKYLRREKPVEYASLVATLKIRAR